jgi:hypothetical protein
MLKYVLEEGLVGPMSGRHQRQVWHCSSPGQAVQASGHTANSGQRLGKN